MEESINKLKYKDINPNTDTEKEIEVREGKIKTVNFNNMKVTDMKCNKRVYLIEPTDIAFETKCENLCIEIMNTVKHLIKENPKP